MNCLEQSIKEKWEPILRGEHKEGGELDCACCLAFLDNSCIDCPIYNYTEVSCCEKTPYRMFYDLCKEFIGYKVYDLHAEVTAAAKWEIDFLEEVNANQVKDGEQ